MSKFTQIITSKDTWIMVGLFVLAYFLMSSVEKMMIEKDTLLPLFGTVPSILIWYFYYVNKK